MVRYDHSAFSRGEKRVTAIGFSRCCRLVVLPPNRSLQLSFKPPKNPGVERPLSRASNVCFGHRIAGVKPELTIYF